MNKQNHKRKHDNDDDDDNNANNSHHNIDPESEQGGEEETKDDIRDDDEGCRDDWIYLGSHNATAAAWGRPDACHLASPVSAPLRSLVIANYELGVLVPKAFAVACLGVERGGEEGVPFAWPGRRYGAQDVPWTSS